MAEEVQNNEENGEVEEQLHAHSSGGGKGLLIGFVGADRAAGNRHVLFHGSQRRTG